MKKFTLWVVALLTLFPGMLRAQDIAGSWQGTLDGPKLRVVMKITKADDGAWKAMLYSIDQGTDGMAANTFSLMGTAVKFSVDAIHGSYEGTLAADGNTIAGAWTQGGKPMPLTQVRATKETAWAIDPSPHKVQFVTVDKDVKLEVLDWGGTGRPLIFLTGLGNDAHVYDKFAPKFTSGWHVYGITRRGFGVSSAPTPADGNYAADRLGDDVLAVMDALKLERPVLVGHSIAGEELSSIGSRHPERVAGLIYLDAAMPYAFYDPAVGDNLLDAIDMRNRLNQILTGAAVPDKKFVAELQTSMTQLEKDLNEMKKDAEIMPPSTGHGPPLLIRWRSLPESSDIQSFSSCAGDLRGAAQDGSDVQPPPRVQRQSDGSGSGEGERSGAEYSPRKLVRGWRADGACGAAGARRSLVVGLANLKICWKISWNRKDPNGLIRLDIETNWVFWTDLVL